ncbi:TPA: hypothetical protein IUC01_003472 [Escherichia coli]|nr:hypothetical protein [Escherichia coli]
MHNLSISDLNSIQFDEKFTGQLLVNVENGRIVRNYHLPDGAIAGSVEALLELAERARLIKPSTSHHDDDLHFTGCMVSHYENGVEVSCERLRDDCCFGTLPEFIELLTSCGYQVIQGVNMRDDCFNSLKQEFSGVPDNAADALSSISEIMRVAFFFLCTDEHRDTGLNILDIAANYADFVTETVLRKTTGGD